MLDHLRPNPRDPGLDAKQMENRVGAADEVADIMEAIKRSLDPKHNVAPEEAAAPARPSSLQLNTGSSSITADSNKHPRTESEESHTASIPVKSDSLDVPRPNSPAAIATLNSVEARFQNLKHDFVFPTHPEFHNVSSSSPNSSIATPSSSALPFTVANQPILTYEHALANLLTELDAVESVGNEEIRRVRRGLVIGIEGELNVLEQQKNEARKHFSSPSAPVGAEVEGYVIPEVAESPARGVHDGEDRSALVNDARAGSVDAVQPSILAAEPSTSHSQSSSDIVERVINILEATTPADQRPITESDSVNSELHASGGTFADREE